MSKKIKKQYLKRVEIGATDSRLFRTIIEQKFVRKNHAEKYIFHGSKSYAVTRIQKLKRYGFLKGVAMLANEPECLLLDKASVKAFRKAKPPAHLAGYTYPKPQNKIETVGYEHDWKTTEVRLIFENLNFCSDWKSEKLLKAGLKGDRKVPDGIFTRWGIGIAVEVELTLKKAKSYRQILGIYDRYSEIKYVLYVCETKKMIDFISDLVRRNYRRPEQAKKEYCFMLFQDLVDFRENAPIWTPFKGNLCLGHLIFGKDFSRGRNSL